MAEPLRTLKNARLRITVNGIVQGVGFRPFVYNLARRLGLTGNVTNTSDGVEIEIQGTPAARDAFLASLTTELPPLAEIISLNTEGVESDDSDRAFRILESRRKKTAQTLISPDISVCEDCLAELFNPEDRRYRYPFINCTNCGPRYTIIRSIPYDRPSTTMSVFPMCDRCNAEYHDPANRRFHAQPNACPDCGPKIWAETASDFATVAEHDSALDLACSALSEGKVVALKGLGGFHLAVDATKPGAVRLLRERKMREEKPLAIMLPDEGAVRNIVDGSEQEYQLLRSPQRPIVLMNKRPAIPVSEEVAPGHHRLGIMLPYTPLHYLLMDRYREYTDIPVLVMTSANLTEEPIVISNEDARKRLKSIADLFILHNRDILIRADDSVLGVYGSSTSFIRRSRGYVPRPVPLHTGGEEILAVGGHLKNTICICKNNQAFLSQHIGDLENLEAYRFFRESVEHLAAIIEAKPRLLAHDLHPGYFSTQWAREQTGYTRYTIQHHHAHMAACMAEWQLNDPTIGIILDGTGYGYDTTVWGGEILVGDYTRVRRVAHLESVPIPGGESAISQPWKTAVGYLYHCIGESFPDLPALRSYPTDAVIEMIQKKINSPLTSSCGRLFDAVAAMCGGRAEIHYEAQAAIELMQASGEANSTPYPYEIRDGIMVLSTMIREIAGQSLDGTPLSRIGSRFHATLISLFRDAAVLASESTGIKDIVLSGGVFQNEIILTGLIENLKYAGFNVYSHRLVPANDGGISLGQAVVARALFEQSMNQVDYQER